MGGGVFAKTHEVQRLNNEELERVSSFITSKLEAAGIKSYAIKSIKEKSDHGDIDILVSTHDGILKLFDESLPNSLNADALSILFDMKYQVDFIKVRSIDCWELSRLFYDFNDCGNLIGRLLNRNSFSFKPHGLYAVYRTPVRKYDIFLNNSIEDVLLLSGLDIERYNQGFDTYKDLFKFIASSRYFGKSIYRYENMTNAQRFRDKKRKTYTAFVEWMEQQDLPEQQKEFDYRPEDYSNFNSEKEIIDAEEHYDNIYRNAFNGHIVTEITGLTGEQLGSFMKFVKNKYTKDQLIERSREIIMDEHGKWENRHDN